MEANLKELVARIRGKLSEKGIAHTAGPVRGGVIIKVPIEGENFHALQAVGWKRPLKYGAHPGSPIHLNVRGLVHSLHLENVPEFSSFFVSVRPERYLKTGKGRAEASEVHIGIHSVEARPRREL